VPASKLAAALAAASRAAAPGPLFEPPAFSTAPSCCVQNDWTYWCGFGVFHSGVEVYGVEYAFGGGAGEGGDGRRWRFIAGIDRGVVLLKGCHVVVVVPAPHCYTACSRQTQAGWLLLLPS